MVLPAKPATDLTFHLLPYPLSSKKVLQTLSAKNLYRRRINPLHLGVKAFLRRCICSERARFHLVRIMESAASPGEKLVQWVRKRMLGKQIGL